MPNHLLYPQLIKPRWHRSQSWRGAVASWWRTHCKDRDIRAESKA